MLINKGVEGQLLLLTASLDLVRSIRTAGILNLLPLSLPTVPLLTVTVIFIKDNAVLKFEG